MMFMTASSRTNVFTAELQGQSSSAERTTGSQQIWNVHEQKWTTDAWPNATPEATYNRSYKHPPFLRKKNKWVKQTQPEPEALLGWGILVCRWFTDCFHWATEKKNRLLLENYLQMPSKNEFTMKSIVCNSVDKKVRVLFDIWPNRMHHCITQIWLKYCIPPELRQDHLLVL